MADGKGCKCAAYDESECGCDADWTPQELIDARAEIKRLDALVESLRREVREQRLEIAGLREERRALLDADRPQPDRLQAIETVESDRPQPIADARLAALQRLVELEEELGLPRTPHPLSTPGEGSVPPEWTEGGEK